MDASGFFVNLALLGIFWVVAVFATVAGAFWFFIPKKARQRILDRPIGPPQTQQIDKEMYSKPKPPAPKPKPSAPVYMRRWNLHRRASVISDKAQWQSEFDRIG